MHDTRSASPGPAQGPVITVISADRLRVRAWEGGSTTELGIFPETASYEKKDFVCRVSTASVEKDCPFSVFEGHERHLLLLDGAGLTLTYRKRSNTLKEGVRQLHFSGAEVVACKLIDGPVRDLNVIYRPGTLVELNHYCIKDETGRLHLNSAKAMQFPASPVAYQEVRLLFALRGSFEITPLHGKTYALPHGGVLRLEQGGQIKITDLDIKRSDAGNELVLISLWIPRELTPRP